MYIFCMYVFWLIDLHAFYLYKNEFNFFVERTCPPLKLNMQNKRCYQQYARIRNCLYAMSLIVLLMCFCEQYLIYDSTKHSIL